MVQNGVYCIIKRNIGRCEYFESGTGVRSCGFYGKSILPYLKRQWILRCVIISLFTKWRIIDAKKLTAHARPPPKQDQFHLVFFNLSIQKHEAWCFNQESQWLSVQNTLGYFFDYLHCAPLNNKSWHRMILVLFESVQLSNASVNVFFHTLTVTLCGFAF